MTEDQLAAQEKKDFNPTPGKWPGAVLESLLLISSYLQE